MAELFTPTDAVHGVQVGLNPGLMIMVIHVTRAEPVGVSYPLSPAFGSGMEKRTKLDEWDF